MNVLFPTRPLVSQYWCVCKDSDPGAFEIFQRHYSYRPAKSRMLAGRRFIGPGEYMLLITPQEDAIFAWRKFRSMDNQDGVSCCIFRNESKHLSSAMIVDAESLAWRRWPGQRLYTYVNPRKVRSTNPGYCFGRAGWRKCGRTTKGLIILEKFPAPSEWPEDLRVREFPK